MAVTDERADQLAMIAVEFAVRVRDEDPDDVSSWLRKVAPTDEDRFQLCFVLAAAVPDDQSFLQLTSWTGQLRPTKTGKPMVVAKKHAGQIRDMADKGMSSDEIGAALGITGDSIRRELRRVA